MWKKKKYTLEEIWNIEIYISKPSLIFIYWDLWVGKTTLSQSIIQRYFGDKLKITSPTYTYYNIYEDITHFDLYRVNDYEYFVSIGWEEILDNNSGIILIEWPEILQWIYTPDIKIYLEKIENQPELRNIKIMYSHEEK